MKKLGFTLAEVLITLVIIGVIAAMAIPTVMNNTNAQEYRTALKKAIETMNNALEMEYALEGLTAQDFKDSATLVSQLFKYRLNVMESVAASGNLSNGFPTARTGNAALACSGTAFATQDGMIFCVQSTFNNTTGCDSYNEAPCGAHGNLIIDVNGLKGPNAEATNSRRPRDQYQASIYAQKVIPFGQVAQEVMFDNPENNSHTINTSAGGGLGAN